MQISDSRGTSCQENSLFIDIRAKLRRSSLQNHTHAVDDHLKAFPHRLFDQIRRDTPFDRQPRHDIPSVDNGILLCRFQSWERNFYLFGRFDADQQVVFFSDDVADAFVKFLPADFNEPAEHDTAKR